MSKYCLTISWLYPDLMSTYGDRGNIIVLEKRCQWRDITVSVQRHVIGSSVSQIQKADILFMGGAQDRQQTLVSEDISGKKAGAISEKIESGTPGLFICGAYQFLGSYYKAADGTKIPGLGIFDVYTEHTGDQKKRLIGNILVKTEIQRELFNDLNYLTIVGFENHGGRTYIGKKIQPFATVIKGFGNNGKDNTEGALYKNAIGTYLHGPVLPKNPVLADWLITQALRVKYGKEITLAPLEDELEHGARDAILRRLT